MSVVHKGPWRRFLLLAAVAAAVALWLVVAGVVPAMAGASGAHGLQHKAKKHKAKKHKAKRHRARHQAKTKHPATEAGKPRHPGPALNGHPMATSLAGHLTSGSYTNSAGMLDYELYVPSRYRAGRPMALVVALHGCTESAASYRQLSGWDAMGQSMGFIVLLPQQLSSRNSLSCWNWFVQGDMQRGSGEPAIIAGTVRSVEQNYSIDTHRVYVAGFSAGGAMANVMGATYPDVFAAVGVGSGCEYDGLPCVGYQGPDPSKTGREAYQAMGTHARVMPAIVFQGDADTIVAPANAPLIVREWQITDDYAAGGSGGAPRGGSSSGSWTGLLGGSPCSGVFSVLPGCSTSGSLNGVPGGAGPPAPTGPIPTAPTGTSSDSVPAGHSYTVTRYGDGQGHELIEYWLVHGMDHAWSEGNSSEQYADPAGPNETAAMYAFFASHSLP